MNQHFRVAALMVALLFIILTGTVEVLGQDSIDNPTSYYSDWVVAISGAVTNPQRLSINDLAAMPKTEVWGSIYCDGELVVEGTWEGVLVSDLINKTDLLKSASNLEFHAYDGYTIRVEVATAIQRKFTIAYELDGQPLKEALRLVVPGYPGNYWINQITEIKVTSSTNYDIGPKPPTPTPKPTMPPLPTKPPTPTPTQQPTTTPKPTETPTAAPTSTPILPATPEPTSIQLANEQTDQEPASGSYSPSYNTIIILAVTITMSMIVSFLFLRRKANLTSQGHPNDLP